MTEILALMNTGAAAAAGGGLGITAGLLVTVYVGVKLKNFSERLEEIKGDIYKIRSDEAQCKKDLGERVAKLEGRLNGRPA